MLRTRGPLGWLQSHDLRRNQEYDRFCFQLTPHRFELALFEFSFHQYFDQHIECYTLVRLSPRLQQWLFASHRILFGQQLMLHGNLKSLIRAQLHHSIYYIILSRFSHRYTSICFSQLLLSLRL